MQLSGSKINTVLRGAADYAAATGMSLDQAVTQIAQAATGMKAVGTTGVMALGGTAASRAIRDAEMLSKKFGGIAAAQAKTVTGQLQQTFNLLNEGVGEIIQASAGPLLKIFRAVVDVVGVLGHWAQENQKVAKTIGYVLAGVAVFLGVGVVLGAVIGVASFALSGFAFVLKAVDIALIVTRGTMWLLSSTMIILRNIFVAFNVTAIAVTGGLKLFRAIMIGVNAVLFANPIGLVIAAVAALATGVYFAIKHWDSLKCILMSVYDFMKSSFITVIDGVKNAVLSLIAPVKNVYEWFVKLLGIQDETTSKKIEKQVTVAANMKEVGYLKSAAKDASNEPAAGYSGYGFGYMPSLTMPATASIGGTESSHNVTIKVEGTNAEVRNTSVTASGQLENTSLNLGTNYSGGFDE